MQRFLQINWLLRAASTMRPSISLLYSSNQQPHITCANDIISLWFTIKLPENIDDMISMKYWNFESFWADPPISPWVLIIRSNLAISIPSRMEFVYHCHLFSYFNSASTDGGEKNETSCWKHELTTIHRSFDFRLFIRRITRSMDAKAHGKKSSSLITKYRNGKNKKKISL